jgi:hypothetical protein
MNDQELTTVAYLLGSMQRALLGEVTPELRGVTVRLGDDGVTSRLIYDSELSAEIIERIDDVETEVIADYSGRTPVACRGVFSPVGERLELDEGELWAYLRHEN